MAAASCPESKAETKDSRTQSPSMRPKGRGCQRGTRRSVPADHLAGKRSTEGGHRRALPPQQERLTEGSGTREGSRHKAGAPSALHDVHQIPELSVTPPPSIAARGRFTGWGGGGSADARREQKSHI